MKLYKLTDQDALTHPGFLEEHDVAARHIGLLVCGSDFVALILWALAHRAFEEEG
jgi:hypothetical protein